MVTQEMATKKRRALMAGLVPELDTAKGDAPNIDATYSAPTNPLRDSSDSTVSHIKPTICFMAAFIK